MNLQCSSDNSCVIILNNGYVIKELDYQDEQEVSAVANLFDGDKEIQEMTGGKNKACLERILDKYSDSDKLNYGKFFICISSDESKQVCGVLVCKHDIEAKILEYKVLAIHKNYRRQGIASSMMSYVEQIYTELAIEKILVGVFPHNKSGIQCYSQQGFEIPFMNKIDMYCAKARAILSNQSLDSIGFYMVKNILKK